MADFMGRGTYGGGGNASVESQISGLGGLNLGGGGLNLDRLLGYLKPKAAAQPAQPRPLLSPLQMQNRAGAENNAGIAEAQARAAEARAPTQPPPREYIHGLGYIGGPDQFMMNQSKMTGAQRRAYLPQNSTMTGGPMTSAASFSGGDTNQAVLEALRQPAPYDIQKEGQRMYGWGGAPAPQTKGKE